MAYVLDPDWDGRTAESSPGVLAVARSLDRTGFYRRTGLKFPELGPGPGEATLYHRVLAQAVGALPVTEVEAQLTAARLFSGLFYLITVLAALDMGRRLSPAPEGILPGAAVAFWPPYVHHMTAVNNDVGVTAAFSLCLWAGVRILSGSPKPGFFLVMAGAAVAALYMKDQGILAPAFAALTVALSLRRWQLGRLAAMAGLLAAWAAVLTWLLPLEWAAYWQSEPGVRRVPGESVHGTAALVVPAPHDRWVNAGQALPDSRMPPPGAVATLGGWVWATGPALAYLRLDTNAGSAGVQRPVQPAPAFIAITTTVPLTATQAAVSLGARAAEKDRPAEVYFDGIVLAAGSFDPGRPPRLDGDAGGGRWGGAGFTNLVRNGSFELAWPDLQVVADRVRFGDKLVQVLDPEVYSWVYGITLQTLIRSLWADLRWSSLLILPDYPMLWLYLTGVAVAGNLLEAGLRLRRKKAGPTPVAVPALAIITLAVWFMVFLRTDFQFWGHTVSYVSRARYAFPVAIPTLWFLVRGLGCWLPGPLRGYRVPAIILVLAAYGLIGLWTALIALADR